MIKKLDMLWVRNGGEGVEVVDVTGRAGEGTTGQELGAGSWESR